MTIQSSDYAGKTAIPENPWDIDYLISKTLSKSGSPGDAQSNGGRSRGQPSPTSKEQIELSNATCRLNHEMVKQCIDDLFEEEGDRAKSNYNDSASDLEGSVQRSGAESSDDTSKQFPVIKRKKGKKGKRNDLAGPSQLRCTLIDGPMAAEIGDSHCNLKIPNGFTGSKSSSSSPVKCEENRTKADAWTSDVASILMDYSCLLPLLSPIRPQSSTWHYCPTAPVLCRLDLNLIPRLPSPIHAKAVEIGLDEVNGHTEAKRSEVKLSCSDMAPLRCDRVSKSESAPKAGDTSTGIEKPLPPATADLDDVPILERMKKSLGSFRRIVKCATTGNQVQLKQSSNPGGSEQTKALNNLVTRVHKPPALVDSKLRDQPERSISSCGTKRQASLHQQHALSEAMEKSTPVLPPQAKRSRMELHSQCLLQMAPHSALRVYMDEKEPQVYLEKAKRVKHAADAQTADKSLRIILYLESVIYFVLTGYCMEKTLSADSSRPYSMLKETCELLKGVSQKYFAQSAVSVDSYVAFLNSKIEVLSLRVQALLCLKLYELRESQAVNNYRHISQYHLTAKEGGDRQCSSANPYVGSGSHGDQQQSHSQHSTIAGIGSSRQTSPGELPSAIAHSPTPSPASSTGSSHSLAPGLVVIPQNVENMYKQQLSHLHNLMWAHLKWNLSVKKMTKEDEQFFAHLDSVCVPLHITSSISELCTFMLTAADWLRRFHSAQSKNFGRSCGMP
ncbi:AF4 [Trichuris trichiura]|uniref:AF4/FMR2 family member lilli n=1 Tax=Trichuris trichiura TaxID=36087 RepID=A0A077ZEQ1_TRITR|nr:AF4 [Trichuris trichiura]